MKENLCSVVKIDTEINDLHEVSNAFNRHFTDISPNLASNINSPLVRIFDLIESCDSTFELELITIDRPRNLVSDIPAGKADGLDGIPTYFLKLSFTFIASSLTHISI